MGCVYKELLFCSLLVIAFPFQSNTDPMGHVLDSLSPQRLVQLRVNPHVSRAHRLLRKVYNGLDGPRSALLERAAMYTLVHVDSVFPRHDIVDGRTLCGLFGGGLRGHF